jgi:hypothetical protein
MPEPSLTYARVEEVKDHWDSWLRCKSCGCTWSPRPGPQGHLPLYWFRCRNGCNADVPAPRRISWAPSKDFGGSGLQHWG